MLSALLSGCGGGSDSPALTTTQTTTTPTTTTTTTTSTTTTTPVTVVPVLSTTPITLQLHASVGTPTWADGPTATGGRGTSIDGVNCVSSEIYHIHAHVAIIKNGEMLAIPPAIGLTGCTYEMHTHDASGVVHIETDTTRSFLLHQFFSLWGMPLSRSNVANITDLPVTVYINDANGLALYSGEIGDIELTAHREITILLGTVPNEIPSYTWVGL